MKSRPAFAGLLLATLAALGPARSDAADWVRIRASGDGDQYFYDRSKLFISGAEITYWKKIVFRNPQSFKDKQAASGLYRERIHCAEHTLKLMSYLLFSPAGDQIEYVAAAGGEAAPIIPDSLGDMFEQTLCPLVRKKQEEEQRAKAASQEAPLKESGPPAENAPREEKAPGQ